MYLEQESEPVFRSGNIARDLVHRSAFPIFVLLMAHIPLALLMRQSALVSTLHAIATLGVGLLWASFDRRIERTAYVMAYIAGAEVLWRMTNAPIFWEFGKYAVVLIAVVSMLSRRRLGGPLLPLLYIILLLPSMILTITGYSVDFARQQISFNLSGPLALMVTAWFAAQLRLTRDQLLQIFLSLIGPVLGIAAIAATNTLTSDALQFSNNSNTVTSGGFGPNQVSALLGLGALCALWYVLDARRRSGFRPLMLISIFIFVTLSGLTFSRGGLYVAGGSAALAALFLARDGRMRIRLVMFTVLLYVLAAFVVVPGLDAFTDGAFSQRFRNTDPTERDGLLETDLQIWRDNPWFGVGPGVAGFSRAQAFVGYQGSANSRVAAHTEFARMLSEHGALGLVALIVLSLMVLSNIVRQQTARDRALAVLLLSWSLLFMFESGMRVVAPSLLFGLSFALFEAPEQQDDE